MLRLGHISYSNCVPVHGRFLTCGPPPDVELVHGVPGELNRRLARGTLEVAPASSIEFARHADRYRIVPGLSISAPASVRTIRVLARTALDELGDGDLIAVPTASATSVVLLKIMMAQRFGIRPEYTWFDQQEEDPFRRGAAAALYIGDAAVRRSERSDMEAHDLGALWNEWTGLPFVFAVWQVNAPPGAEERLGRLARALHESRDWSSERLGMLAERWASTYGWSAPDLLVYWRTLEFGWNDDLEAALLDFYRRASEIGALERVPDPAYLDV